MASILYNVRYTDHESNIILYNVRLHRSRGPTCLSFCIMADTLGLRDLCNLTLYRMMLDSWSVYLPLYRMTNMLDLVICVSDIIQNGFHVGLVNLYLTLYRMTPCWTRDMCIWHYYRMNNEITSPTWRPFCKNIRYTDHESNMASFCYNVRCTDHESQHGVHSVKFQIHRSRVPTCFSFLYNGRLHRSQVQHGSFSV